MGPAISASGGWRTGSASSRCRPVGAVHTDGSWGAWAVEVKTGTFTGSGLSGLFEFTRRNPRFRPLVLCDESGVDVAGRLGLAAMDYRDYLGSDFPAP